MKRDTSEKTGKTGESSPLLSIFTASERSVFSSIAFFSGFLTFTFVHKQSPSEKRISVSFYDGVRTDENVEVVFYTAKNREPLHHRHDLSANEIVELLEGFSVGVLPFFFRSRYGEIEGFDWDDFVFREDLAQFYFYAENDRQEVVRLYARRVMGGGTRAFVFEKLYYKADTNSGEVLPFESRSSAYIEDFPVKTVAQFFMQLGEKGRETLGIRVPNPGTAQAARQMAGSRNRFGKAPMNFPFAGGFPSED